jgi:hypothetical protein
MPQLPNSLNSFTCDNNQLTSLPSLPNSITFLFCNNNQLTVLPTLPSSLTLLACNSNKLVSLPALPSTLDSIFCENNQLTILPSLPNSLQRLFCNSNYLQCLPSLPNSLWELVASGNSITCLPNIPTNFNFTSDIGTTTCNSTNNTYNCSPSTGASTVTATLKAKTTDQLNVYPNPTSGMVSVSSSRTGTGIIRVMSADGRLIRSIENIDLSTTNVIDLSAEVKGIYIMQLVSGGDVITNKIVLN